LFKIHYIYQEHEQKLQQQEQSYSEKCKEYVGVLKQRDEDLQALQCNYDKWRMTTDSMMNRMEDALLQSR
jgi:arginyl-tRNA synthetase